MALKPKQDPSSPALVETVDEIMKIYRSLPPRPSIEDVEAAMSVLKTVNTEEQMKLEEITSKQDVPPQDVPSELFSVLQQVRKNTVLFHSHEERKEAVYLVEVDKMFQTFDELIQRASELVPGGGEVKKETDVGDPIEKKGRTDLISDESLIKKKEDVVVQNDDSKRLLRSSSTKAIIFSG